MMLGDGGQKTEDRRRRSLSLPAERRVAEQLMIEIREFIPCEADCYTLLCDFYIRCYGIELPRYEYNSVKQEKPPDQVWEDWRIIDESEAGPGDVIQFHSELGLHLGIVLDEGDFIHASCFGSPPVRIEKIADIPAENVDYFARYRHK